jgi:hypothetical protein
MNAVKSLILGVCIAGATAAFATSHIGAVPMVPSHQAVVAAVPIPSCSPGYTCNGGKGKSAALVAAVPIPSCSPGYTCNGGKGKSAALVAAVPIPSCSPGYTCNGGKGKA